MVYYLLPLCASLILSVIITLLIQLRHALIKLTYKDNIISEYEAKVQSLQQKLQEEYEQRVLLSATLSALEKTIHKDIESKFETLCFKMLERSTTNIKSAFSEHYQRTQQCTEKDSQIARANLKDGFIPILQQMSSMKDNIEKTHQSYLKECENIKKHLCVNEQQCLELSKHTKTLSQALSTPYSKGKWGEMQLKRIVELCGLVSYCDFEEQHTFPDGKRPDLVIKLPGNKRLAIDAKNPIDAQEEEVGCKPKTNITNLKKHVQSLSNKDYVQTLNSFSFVVLFLPHESLLSEALNNDPSIIEWSASKNVIITTPATTIALLKSISMCWSTQKSLENSDAIAKLSGSILKQMELFLDKLGVIRKIIDKLLSSFDSLLKTTNTQIVPKLNQINEMSGINNKNTIPNHSDTG